MEEIRLGTVGSGMIVRIILDCMQKVEGIRLCAVYSRSPETARKLAEEYGAGKIYTDLDVMLSDPEINCVYIATPNSLHYPQAKKALLAGKHVICEKPFCTKAGHAAELALLARQLGLMLVEAVPTAFLPHLEVLRQQLPKIGRIRLVMGNFSQYSSRYDLLRQGQVPNIFNPRLGGGCLMDIHFYNVWLHAALLGPPETVHYCPNLHPCGSDTSGMLTLRYPDFVSQTAGAKDTWGENFIQIEGEEGYIYAVGGSAALLEIRVVTKTGREVIQVQPEPVRWLYEARALTDLLLREDRQTLAGLMEISLHTSAILEKARHAAGIRFPEDEA